MRRKGTLLDRGLRCGIRNYDYVEFSLLGISLAAAPIGCFCRIYFESDYDDK